MARDRLPLILRATLIAVLVVLLAVTPLSAIFRPAYFEVVFPGRGLGAAFSVVVDDRTGLVAGVSPVEFAEHGPVSNGPGGIVSNGPGGNRRVLFVSISGGCGDHLTWLTFEHVGDGFRIEARTTRVGCPYLMLLTRHVAIHLRAPVDASAVEFEALN
jgi:hypothetical protein